MSRFKKAVARLMSRPNDFTWGELQTIMKHFGYQEKKGGGSARKFTHPKTKVVVSLHEPHPKPQMKRYAIDIIIEHLQEEELL
jgi:predicted RNA binding protein YcfA (HicA-like mRNA interferase family)